MIGLGKTRKLQRYISSIHFSSRSMQGNQNRIFKIYRKRETLLSLFKSHNSILIPHHTTTQFKSRRFSRLLVPSLQSNPWRIDNKKLSQVVKKHVTMLVTMGCYEMLWTYPNYPKWSKLLCSIDPIGYHQIIYKTIRGHCFRRPDSAKEHQSQSLGEVVKHCELAMSMA